MRSMRLAAAILSALPLFVMATPKEPTSPAISEAVESYISTKENMFTGNTLYELRGLPRFFEGYVSGVVDSGALDSPWLRYCLPAGIKVPQMADVAYKYLVDKPATRHLGAAHLVRQALREAWPCPAEVADQPAKRRSPL